MLRIFPFLKIKTRFRSGLFNEKSSQAIILPVLQLAKGQIYYLLTSSHYLLGNYTSSFCVSIFDLLLLSSVCISQKTNNKSPVLVLYRNCMRDKLVLWPVAICTSLFDYLVLLSPSCLHYFTWLFFSPLPLTICLPCCLLPWFITKLLFRLPTHAKDHVRTAHLQPVFSVWN